MKGFTTSVVFASVLLAACLPRSARQLQGEAQDSAAVLEPSEEPASEEPSEETANLPPVAQCTEISSSDSFLYQLLSLDGSESYDPEGGDLTFLWELDNAPYGSMTQIAEPQSKLTLMQPDLVGRYVASLVVTDDLGQTDKCKLVVQAAPSQRLWVELIWNVQGDNLDLHLLSPAAAQEDNWYQFLLGEDCYSGNCEDGLEWGDPNSTNDNPQIVLNEEFAHGETGLGPEVIFIPQPQEQTYTVVVHDVATELGLNENNFTVQVYLDGELALRTDQVAPEEGHYLRVAEIDTTSWTATAISN